MVCERSHPTQSPGGARNRRLTLAGVSATFVAVAVAAIRACRRVVVAGESMRPAFEPGDRVLVVPVLRVRPGHVVAVPDPRRPDRLLLKRVLSTGSGLVDVRGDNEPASTDSRHFGQVARSSVVGRAIYRYGPAGRVGRLG